MTDFIDHFLALTKNSRSPYIFRKWTAISMIASAMGRGVYTVISEPDGPIYPNFYIILVGPPGMGKSIGSVNGRRIVKRVPSISTGPDKITPERLVSKLTAMTKEQDRAVMALFIDELSVLLQRKGDFDLTPILTGAYNCPEEFIYETESKQEQRLANCCLNIIATTQPAYIAEKFTISDLGQGFPSRLFFIYSDQAVPAKYFKNYPDEKKHTSDLVKALTEIEMFKGTIKWSDDAQEFFVKLTDNKIPPVPTAPHLEHYCSRRDLHLTKLSLVMMRARDPRAMQLEREDVERAHTTMLEAEETMPLALSAIGGNQYRVAQNYLISYVTKQMAEGHPSTFPASELHRLLTANLTPREAGELLGSLISQGLCSTVGDTPQSAAYTFSRKRVDAHVRAEQTSTASENRTH